jgi:hypothetical protein
MAKKAPGCCPPQRGGTQPSWPVSTVNGINKTPRKAIGAFHWSWTKTVALAAMLVKVPLLQLLPYLTFLSLVVAAWGFVTTYALVLLLCLLGMCFRPLIHRQAYWFALASIVSLGNYLTWYSADNHKYLMAYWCVALGCVHAVPQERRSHVLTINARLLLGLCMAFATGYKVLTPSYIDGSFFRYRLLSDKRFKYVACHPGNVPLQTWRENRREEDKLVQGYIYGQPVDTVQLIDSPRLRILALGMTWWALVIEGGLALLFLWPGERPALWRHRLLLLFVCTTYAIAPVIGFGWLLVLLGIAQVPESSRRLRAAYLGAFLLIPAYALPYQWVLSRLLRCWT